MTNPNASPERKKSNARVSAAKDDIQAVFKKRSLSPLEIRFVLSALMHDQTLKALSAELSQYDEDHQAEERIKAQHKPAATKPGTSTVTQGPDGDRWAMRERVKSRVYKVVSDQLGISRAKIKEEDSIINDLGADSLDQVELVMAIEDEFGIEIPDEKAEATATVCQIIDGVTEEFQRQENVRLTNANIAAATTSIPTDPSKY